MDDDEVVKRPLAHAVGMPIDTLSIEELGERIELLEAEIERLRAAIEARQRTRSAADSLFKL